MNSGSREPSDRSFTFVTSSVASLSVLLPLATEATLSLEGSSSSAFLPDHRVAYLVPLVPVLVVVDVLLSF